MSSSPSPSSSSSTSTSIPPSSSPSSSSSFSSNSSSSPSSLPPSLAVDIFPTINAIIASVNINNGDNDSDDVVTVQKAAEPTNFSVYISVLMGILVAVSLFLNLALIASVLSSRKLRSSSSLLHLMFCVLASLNLFDILAIMLLSLLCVSDDGQWTFGHSLCRLNAFAQQFVFLSSLLFLTLMAMERALGLLGRHLVTIRFFGLLSAIFLLVPLCFSAPLLVHTFPVSVYPFRYLCAIGNGSPLLYSVVQLLVYGGCLFVLLLCLGSILKHKNAERTLPVKPQDYGAFIMESRALEEHVNLSRAVLFLTMEFLIVQGPYICLNFFMQLRNSAELIRQFGEEFLMAQDVDTLATMIKLFHPLFVPMLIFAFCADLWTNFVNLLCCRRPNFGGPSLISRVHPPADQHATDNPGPDNVLTVFATSEGLQLHIPQYRQSQQHQMTAIGSPEGAERSGMIGNKGTNRTKRQLLATTGDAGRNPPAKRAWN